MYLAIIVTAGFTGNAYNQYIDKWLATIYENFSYEIFVNQKILFLPNFITTEIWYYGVYGIRNINEV